MRAELISAFVFLCRHCRTLSSGTLPHAWVCEHRCACRRLLWSMCPRHIARRRLCITGRPSFMGDTPTARMAGGMIGSIAAVGTIATSGTIRTTVATAVHWHRAV